VISPDLTPDGRKPQYQKSILRCGAAGVFEPIKSGFAIKAAERTDSDSAEEILLQEPAAM